MINGIPKHRVCFWLSDPVHTYLQVLANDGKVALGNKRYSVGDAITDLCTKKEPDILEQLKELEKVSNVS